ncbi:DNA repair protein RecN [Urechidicola vernalis]|uniref:DNA repair protein RecN n=1 Tax=Urechidicola vernalis TaxID=3075600 RepID=A0ABU2Y6X4_9FLAO|nr:DNA repair protein RecN [Urechidicola sp. P050]MDT0553958.1 DNA repair protein RecN [Urechidicola sp. P050]
MLTTLSIKNYALIDELHVTFDNGFSIITGETGAGKSILLGALGLVLGKRADSSTLKQKDKKCVVEAEFRISNYQLESLFKDENLDFEEYTIIRREILPSGKSRAFINDTPTTLGVLNKLSERLIDVHSQHQTLELANSDFQFELLDALAENRSQLDSYKKGLDLYKKQSKTLSDLLEAQAVDKEQYEYNLYLFNELESANLKYGEQELVEKQLVVLNNSESIKENLSELQQISDNEEYGLINMLNLFKTKLQKLADYSFEYESLYTRAESLEIELKDVSAEIESENEKVVFNPAEIDRLNDRLQLIYDLYKKHGVDTIEALHVIHETLSDKVDVVENSSKRIAEKRGELNDTTLKLQKLSDSLSSRRNNEIPKLTKQLESILASLGMGNAKFKIELSRSTSFLANGKDNIELQFSANKGASFGMLKKVASGGELSRIMLAVKLVLSKYIKLPTIIFDEIDTGVSGEIAHRMGVLMQEMSENMQVMSISHLPQIASKGRTHFKVYKTEDKGVVRTQLKKLEKDERVLEIAEMLGGKNISDSALTHAKELLN